ncbi:hypothetical protein EXIGLDRAFT_184089 [Exidia glandulosa HHB12029]|uniref:Uncharacterized protein n=1 Tax=Exidia glandulosa HHB12029 TaxID=1314781 RepID=A0A165F1N7_EXIGL|nr:hypothetical protein EXIGLDRAFT_184089 [Exidia glandulosa HHB12029]
MPKLWGMAGPCPQHGHDFSDCSGSCLPELFSCLILQTDLDNVLLRRLWDQACWLITAPLSCLPTFLRYITSEAFLDHAHAQSALHRIQYYIDSPNSWRGTTTLPAMWMTAWRYLAFSLRSGSQPFMLNIPFNLIAAALSDGKHQCDPRFVQQHSGVLPLSAGDFLRSILCVFEAQPLPIPSLWALLCPGTQSIYDSTFAPSLDIIAAALCSLSRTEIETNELIFAFFEPMQFDAVMLRLFYFEHYVSEFPAELVVPTARETTLRICVHLMQLCPSWWTQGMNQLMHEVLTDEYILRSQRIAEEITAEALAHGPCHDCPLTMTPLAFDFSLRSFTLFPFAVYPLLDTETCSA